MLLQQGDVLLVPSRIPEGAKPVPPQARGVVLAEGEHTGHAHVIAPPQGVAVELVERNGVTYLRTSGFADLVHEEHRAIEVPAGEYEVRRVQEYDHFAEEARDVQD